MYNRIYYHLEVLFSPRRAKKEPPNEEKCHHTRSHPCQHYVRFLIAALLLALGAALPAPRAAYAAGVVGSGTPASCTEADLAAKLSGGGTITFNCGPSPATIAITSEKLISADTTLDGGGKITLHGNGATRILRSIDGNFNGTAVLKVINVTIKGLTIENGVTSDQGGAIKVGFWNNFTLKDSTLRDNRATKDDENCAGGGAIFIGGGGTARIEGSSFSGNQANNGGAINSLRTNLTVIASQLRQQPRHPHQHDQPVRRLRRRWRAVHRRRARNRERRPAADDHPGQQLQQ